METISISNLKAHLSATMKRVRAGGTIVVVDRDVPIAEIKPFPGKKRGIVIHPPSKKEMSGSLHLKVSLDIDPVEYLVEDRRRGRL